MSSSLPAEVVALLSLQAGVVSRRQVLGAGLAPHDIKRLLRRREWTTRHPGVYLDHTGEPTWLQRAWIGVLALWPAALWGPSALHAADGPGTVGRGDGVVHVAVARDRSLPPTPPPGVRVHQVARLQESVGWHRSPPAQRYELAVLTVALAATDEMDVIATLAAACGSRRTTAARLLAALGTMPRVRRRAWVTGVLRDVAEGTCSVLEHGYATSVERAHGLPRARRQLTGHGPTGVVYRDAALGESEYVELDGSLLHSSAHSRDRDMDRDLLAAGDGAATVRLGWGQVFGRPCWTAYHLVRWLRSRGVPVSPHHCSPGCPVWELVDPTVQ